MILKYFKHKINWIVFLNIPLVETKIRSKKVNCKPEHSYRDILFMECLQYKDNNHKNHPNWSLTKYILCSADEENGSICGIKFNHVLYNSG